MWKNVSFFVEKWFMDPNSTSLDSFRALFIIGRNIFVTGFVCEETQMNCKEFHGVINV